MLSGVMMAAGAPPAFAKSWLVDYAKSKLGFVGAQSGVSFQGSFKSFITDIKFDPAHPETGSITATIEIGSATAGNPERDGYLPQPDWFDAKNFPTAQFVSTVIRAAGNDKNGATCFEADGNLTIKGITKPVKMPFCLKQEGYAMHAQGRVKLIRTDFDIGTGQWSDESVVRRGVDVVIDITATP